MNEHILIGKRVIKVATTKNDCFFAIEKLDNNRYNVYTTDTMLRDVFMREYRLKGRHMTLAGIFKKEKIELDVVKYTIDSKRWKVICRIYDRMPMNKGRDC